MNLGNYLVNDPDWKPSVCFFSHKFSFEHVSYSLISLSEKEVYERICQTLKINRIARKNPVNPNSYRSSNVELLWGDNGIVQHTDNKIK
jgi:hypothetical protein